VRVIPVLDLRAGRAVLARGGVRHAYEPVQSVLVAASAVGDAVALARAFRERLGCDECYVADLDAITGGHPQRALVRALAGVGGRLLVDSGLADPASAAALLAEGAVRVVVGLETLPAFGALEAIAGAIGPERVVFSLDLRDGQPVLAPGARHHESPLALARAAAAAGAAALLVLDLARVGARQGPDLELVDAVRGALPEVELLVGGGVRTREDLERLAAAGCDAALLATALHDGRVGRADLDAVRRRGPAPLEGGPHSSDSR
jgi:phosphoribosylformimino-5-aminoimidazole carboxamide ribotide isomerase